MSLRILLLGSGGREHALAWKLSKSKLVEKMFACPGNGGTINEQKTSNITLPITDFEKLIKFALENEVHAYRLPCCTPLMIQGQSCRSWAGATLGRWRRKPLSKR